MGVKCSVGKAAGNINLLRKYTIIALLAPVVPVQTELHRIQIISLSFSTDRHDLTVEF